MDVVQRCTRLRSIWQKFISGCVFGVKCVVFFFEVFFFRIQQGERGPRVDRKTSIEFTWPLLLLLYVVKISTRMQFSLEKAHQLG